MNARIDAVEFLVANGADLNAKTTYGWTPLPCCNERANRCETLLANGAHVNAKTNDGETALIAGPETVAPKSCKRYWSRRQR